MTPSFTSRVDGNNITVTLKMNGKIQEFTRAVMATSTNAAFPQYIYETPDDWGNFTVYGGETGMLDTIEGLRDAFDDDEFDGELSDCKEYSFMADVAKNRAAYEDRYGNVIVFDIDPVGTGFFEFVKWFCNKDDFLQEMGLAGQV